MILGIQCELTDAGLRRDVEHVLTVIRNDHPEDFRWLSRLLVKIAPHPSPEPGDLGECVFSCMKATADEFWASRGDPLFEQRKIVFLVEEAIDQNIAQAVIAHELGHVLGTEDQRACVYREVVEDEEWASESLADLYALRWGFERQLREMRLSGCPLHHRLSVDELLPLAGAIGEWQTCDPLFTDAL